MVSMIQSTGKIDNIDTSDTNGHNLDHIASFRGYIPLMRLPVESGSGMRKLSKYDYKGQCKGDALTIASFGRIIQFLILIETQDKSLPMHLVNETTL